MMLDIQAARAVAMARLFETCVNDRGPWHIRIGDVSVPAVRIRTTDGIVFVAHFGPGVAADTAWLLCRGQEISSLAVEPAPEGFQFEWRVGVAPDKQNDRLSV